jgi:hypothetical protein
VAEIDLGTAGKMVGSAQFAKDYTFLIVADRPKYTPQVFEQNVGAATGEDLIFRSAVLPDENGSAELDLQPHLKQIRSKLPNVRTAVKFVLVGTMLNYPGKRRAVMESHVLLRGEPAIRLVPQGPKAYAGDDPPFKVKVQAQDLDEVECRLDPADPKIATLSKAFVAAKTDYIYLSVKGSGKVKFVAQGKVGGAVRVIESCDIECIGDEVKIEAIGFTPA